LSDFDDEHHGRIGPLLRPLLELALPRPDEHLGQVGLGGGYPGARQQACHHEQRHARGANASSHVGHYPFSVM
jgi:hypothetical protein